MDARWRWAGDRALLRTFGGAIDEANRAARAAARELRRFDEAEDVVPGARTVLVLLAPGSMPSDALIDALERDPAAGGDEDARTHRIPVAYGGDDGPDLAAIARHAGMSEREVVRLHAGARYVVAFIGFSPGFPYLLGLPAALHVPRLDTPRARVAAGSVAIAGGFAGMYPHATPGGWRVIGRTDASLFDVSRHPPASLAPGDVVRFVGA